MRKLLDMPPSRKSIATAAMTALLLSICCGVSLLFAARPLPHIAPFLPMFATAVVILEGLTSFLLATLYRATRTPVLAILSGAYAFTVVMSGIQILIFPGVFTPTGLLGAGPQSAIWVWTFWHAGYPLFALAALAAAIDDQPAMMTRLWRALARVVLPGAPILAIVLVGLAVYNGGLLPPLIDGLSYVSLRHSLAAKIIIFANILALGMCVGVNRCRNMLTLWLAVALLASFFDALVTLLASQRYSLGWYSARVTSLVSSSAVLGVLIWEITVLYRRLSSDYLELSEKVIRDGLTGLFNRAYFDTELPRDIRAATRDGCPISLLMVDADRFKSFNDHHGHLRGDQCLIALAGAFETVARRPRDYAVRFGGEEFAVILPDTDENAARHCAEKLRSTVHARAIARTDGPPEIVTVSIGGATWRPEDAPTDAQALIARADANLYRAKAGGRDRAFFDDDAISPTQTAESSG